MREAFWFEILDILSYLDTVADMAELSLKWGGKVVGEYEGEGEGVLTGLYQGTRAQHGVHVYVLLTRTKYTTILHEE